MTDFESCESLPGARRVESCAVVRRCAAGDGQARGDAGRQCFQSSLGAAQQGANRVIVDSHQVGGLVDGEVESVVEQDCVGLRVVEQAVGIPAVAFGAGCPFAGLVTQQLPGVGGWAGAAQNRGPSPR
nr:hypothetical protein [Streptomyces sp. Termitarium-T10T-6]